MFTNRFLLQCRDPVFLLLKGLQIFPLYSVKLISFMLVLAAIDRSDEYQLLQFILQFKGTQFLTIGLFGAIAGATRYHVCINLFTASQAGQQHSCDTIGPVRRLIYIRNAYAKFLFRVSLPTTILSPSYWSGARLHCSHTR